MEEDRRQRFERLMLPHLGAAYNLARWLTRSDCDAEDVVQEAYLRAYRFFDSFHGEPRPWLLAVVRNTCFTWLKQHARREPAAPFDEAVHGGDVLTPEQLCARKDTQQVLHKALEELPAEFREVVVLRELEGHSYKEIAAIAGIPLGTVMSRLTRARTRLQEFLSDRMRKEW